MLARPNPSREEQQEWAVQTRRSAEHLLGLLNDILDLSKIEAGELTISCEPCALSEILADVTSVLQPFAQEKLLSLQVTSNSSPQMQLVSDPTRLRQILINLVHNAIKFTDKGTVSVVVEETPTDIPPRLTVAVRDTGVGIPPQKLEEIFKPFHQLSQSQTNNAGGVGLGLTISRHLVGMLGGELTARNLAGGGTEFIFELPIEEVAAPASSSYAAQTPENRGPAGGTPVLEGTNVLVVDDNPDNQRIIRFLLEEIKMAVTPAIHGQDAVDIILDPARRNSFDVVLMDIQMPVMDGYAATRRMRESGIDIPIIALTAHAMLEDKARCLIVGCDDYVSKPIVPENLYRCLAKHISKRDDASDIDDHRQTVSADNPLVSSMADNAKFAPILAAYLESLANARPSLSGHLSERDWPALQGLAHRLRGTAANHGFPTITEAAGACEDLIRQQAPEDQIMRQGQALARLLRAATF